MVTDRDGGQGAETTAMRSRVEAIAVTQSHDPWGGGGGRAC